MRVINRNGKLYTVEATEDELLKVAGFESPYMVPRTAEFAALWPMANRQKYVVPIGSEIKVSDAFDYLHLLRLREADAAKGVVFLRKLADMLDLALPTTIVPPIRSIEVSKSDELSNEDQVL